MNVYYSLNNDKVLNALDLLREVLNENLAYGARLARYWAKDAEAIQEKTP